MMPTLCGVSLFVLASLVRILEKGDDSTEILFDSSLFVQRKESYPRFPT